MSLSTDSRDRMYQRALQYLRGRLRVGGTFRDPKRCAHGGTFRGTICEDCLTLVDVDEGEERDAP